MFRQTIGNFLERNLYTVARIVFLSNTLYHKMKRNKLMMFIMLFLLISFLFTSMRSYILNGGYSLEWEVSFWQNLSTEIVGALFTYTLFEIIINNNTEKETMIEKLKSKDKSDAHQAWKTIETNNWHTDGTLKKRNLSKIDLEGRDLSIASLQESDLSYSNLSNARFDLANLEGANLSHANLSNANFAIAVAYNIIGSTLKNATLEEANLSEVKFHASNLENANLRNANLTHASLYKANLKNATLVGANLSNADMEDANLDSANLRNASLRNAILKNVKFGIETVLPDAEYIRDKNYHTKYWTPKTDMERYTNPDHPNFWEPGQGEIAKIKDSQNPA